MAKKVLVIDDDTKLLKLLSEYFSQFDLETLTSDHPLEGLRLLKNELPDVVILDVMLPGMDGFEVLREIRKDNHVPVIMLTARGETSDKVLGLETGADDYLAKPFEPRELVARIQSILRRQGGGTKSNARKYGDLKVDFNKHSAYLSGKDIGLTSMEFAILKLLIDNSSMVLSRDQISEHIQDFDWDPGNRSIDVLLSRLRQKLGDDPKEPHYLKTVWGSGYMFIGDSDEEA